MNRKTFALLFVVLAVFALGLVPAFAEDPAVKLMKKEGVGSYLTDAQGMTLYYFVKDTPGKSACAGECLQKWPAVKADAVAAMPGLEAKDFGSLVREDGRQATFRGYPLYYFFKDAKPGDTNGQGFNNVWFVIDPAKFPPTM
jgi:predicted lipoprotein with Yx(FWY)xxD motif